MRVATVFPVMPADGLIELTAILQRSVEAIGGAARQAQGAAPAEKT